MMSSSSILVIQIPTTMDSVMTQKKMMVLKPLNLNFHRGIHIQHEVNHRVNWRNSVLPLRCSTSTPSSSSENDDGAVVLHVRGMMCDGCASSVKKILETQPQVLSATVNLASETALVSLISSDKTSTNWQKHLGETLAHHLTTCGFTSTLTESR